MEFAAAFCLIGLVPCTFRDGKMEGTALDAEVMQTPFFVRGDKKLERVLHLYGMHQARPLHVRDYQKFRAEVHLKSHEIRGFSFVTRTSSYHIKI